MINHGVVLPSIVYHVAVYVGGHVLWGVFLMSLCWYLCVRFPKHRYDGFLVIFHIILDFVQSIVGIVWDQKNGEIKRKNACSVLLIIAAVHYCFPWIDYMNLLCGLSCIYSKTQGLGTCKIACISENWHTVELRYKQVIRTCKILAYMYPSCMVLGQYPPEKNSPGSKSPIQKKPGHNPPRTLSP